MLIGPSVISTPNSANASRRKTFIAPVFGDNSSAHPSANSTPGMAIGIRINAQARLRQGMSVRSISQANRTAMTTVMAVPTVASTSVVASAW